MKNKNEVKVTMTELKYLLYLMYINFFHLFVYSIVNLAIRIVKYWCIHPQQGPKRTVYAFGGGGEVKHIDQYRFYAQVVLCTNCK